ncbi:MAG: hypothetical protein DRN90_03205 [Thermoproteota archaeon]|nr:MAG: hypothetical protein DRN92_08400 [Candidatus Korarchaeota archaeon]RLG48704.1 MAG: hypothetical protein DRN90_03205 [Candidatus Korarchaeota archaeon]
MEIRSTITARLEISRKKILGILELFLAVFQKNLLNMFFLVISLRNMIIHRYWEVDERRLYRESKESIGLIKKFIEEVKNYASKD